LTIHAARLTEAERSSIEAEVNHRVDQAFRQALGDPFPSLI